MAAAAAASEEIEKLNEKLNDLKQDNLTLASQVEILDSEKDEMEIQLKSFARVNEAVVNMLLETRQRAGVAQAEDPDSVAAIRQRQALYNQNPHVTTDQLRAQLRVLLAAKDGYEKNLKKALAEKEKTWHLQISLLTTEVKELTEFKMRSEQAIESVWEKVREAEDAQGLTVTESREIIEELKADNLRMIVVLEQKDLELHELAAEIHHKEVKIEEQGTKLHEVNDIENNMKILKLHNALEMKRCEAQAHSKLQELDKQNDILRRDVSRAQGLRDQVAQAQAESAVYKSDIRRSKMVDSDKRVERCERYKTMQETKLNNSQKQVKQLALLTEKTTADNVKLEKEYRKMFSAVKQQQKEMVENEQRAAREMDAEGARKMAEQNPFYIDTYKRKLLQKEQELESLKAKIRRMTVSENRGALLRKTMQAERSKYEAEIANLRSKVVQMPGASASSSRRPGSASVARSASTSLKLLPDNGAMRLLENENTKLKTQLKELENVRTMSETTSQAFQNLLKQHHELEASVLRERSKSSMQ